MPDGRSRSVHSPNSEILVAPDELRAASGSAGRARGYLPHRWPTWFDPMPLDLAAEPFGPFARSRRLTDAGDIIAVAVPDYTADHVSVLAHVRGFPSRTAGAVSCRRSAGRSTGSYAAGRAPPWPRAHAPALAPVRRRPSRQAGPYRHKRLDARHIKHHDDAFMPAGQRPDLLSQLREQGALNVVPCA